MLAQIIGMSSACSSTLARAQRLTQRLKAQHNWARPNDAA